MEFTYFCTIDSSNTVRFVTQIENRLILGDDGEVSIQKGIEHLESTVNIDEGCRWMHIDRDIHTCNIGFIYLPDYNTFITPQPYKSWTLDANTFEWVPPVPLPNDSNQNGKRYIWIEEIKNWLHVN